VTDFGDCLPFQTIEQVGERRAVILADLAALSLLGYLLRSSSPTAELSRLRCSPPPRFRPAGEMNAVDVTDAR
jgi:hypothetical protein